MRKKERKLWEYFDFIYYQLYPYLLNLYDILIMANFLDILCCACDGITSCRIMRLVGFFCYCLLFGVGSISSVIWSLSNLISTISPSISISIISSTPRFSSVGVMFRYYVFFPASSSMIISYLFIINLFGLIPRRSSPQSLCY